MDGRCGTSASALAERFRGRRSADHDVNLQLSRGQLTPRSTLPAEKPNRVLVDRATGAKGNQFDQPLWSNPIDDPEPSNSKTVQPREIVAKLLSRSGILTDDVEARPNLALEARMKTPDEILDGLWNAKAVDDRVSRRGSVLRGYRFVHPS